MKVEYYGESEDFNDNLKGGGEYNQRQSYTIVEYNKNILSM